MASVATREAVERFEQALGRPLASRRDFIVALGAALERQDGYAAGKIGGSEQALLLYPIVLEREDDPGRRRAFELSLVSKALRHAGIFPPRPDFYRRFAEVYAGHVRRLDSLGVFAGPPAVELDIVRHHRLETAPIPYWEQEPDRSSPSEPARCYLHHFRGRDVLLVCPFANLLRERATRTTFEAVWAKTGKKWFDPARVDSVEFPYGFARATRDRYPTALDLLDDITAEMDTRTYDVALIAAGGLGIPLASFAKGRGKVGISLGGHLQVLFGVLGKRWRRRGEWADRYFNEAWIDMPAKYRPDPSETNEDYW